MLAVLQRHEVEKYCLDNKITFFGCSLDGESAFEVVDRSIQLRELYCAGEEGDFWKSSKYSYDDSMTKIKMQGNLSRQIEEKLGVKQGHINSSDNYRVYISNMFPQKNLRAKIMYITVQLNTTANLYILYDKHTKNDKYSVSLEGHWGQKCGNQSSAQYYPVIFHKRLNSINKIVIGQLVKKVLLFKH